LGRKKNHRSRERKLEKYGIYHFGHIVGAQHADSMIYLMETSATTKVHLHGACYTSEE
jgi:hypothetical protein